MFYVLDIVINIVSIIALIGAFTSLWLNIKTKQRIDALFKNTDIKNFEDLLVSNNKTIEELLHFREKLKNKIKDIDNRIKTKTSKATTIRFNPFEGQGICGNQSFSTILASEEGDGIIVTSMHTRDRTNVFAKPILKWQSEYELSEEEKTLITEHTKQK